MDLQILIILFTFLFVGLSGFIIFRTITKEKNPLFLISAGIVFGLCIYIFLLNINSKFLPGPSGIILSTVELLALSFYLYIKYRKKWIDINMGKQIFSLGGLFLVLLTFFIYIRLTTLFPAADSTMQWAYAGAFARGNHPLMMPWQPDLPPNYHLGAYFFEGALQLFSGLSYTVIHTLVNIFFLVPLIILSVIILWERKNKIRNIWLILAALVFFLPFGVLVFMYPNLISTGKTIVGLSQADKIISSIPAKGEGGAPLVSLHILTLLPARSLALGFVLLALSFIRLQFTNNKFKILSLVLIFAVTALVEESIFMPMFLTFVTAFAFSLFSFIPKLNYLKKIRKTFFIIIILSSILIILQGGFITDNLFTRKESAYRIISPLDPTFAANLNVFHALNLKSISLFNNFNLYIPSPLLIIVVLLAYSLIKKEPFTGLLGIFAGISFALYSAAEYIYCPSCSLRIYSLGNIAAGYGFMLLIFFAMLKFSSKKNLLLFLILIPTFIFPTLFPDIVVQAKSINQGLREKKSDVIFTKTPHYQEPMTKWANKNLPINSRIIVLDNEFPSPGGSLHFQYYGLYTTFSPQFIRSNRQEPGIEFFDLALTLNPSIFKKTKTDYIYIESPSLAYKQLPQFRKDDLNNKKYFEILRSYDSKDSLGNEYFFRIYKVLPLYFDPTFGGKEIGGTTLEKLADLMPDKKSIYIGDYGEKMMNFWYRMALVLALKDKDIRRHLTQTEYQVIETFFNRKESEPNEIYDYYILSPNENPPVEAEKIWENTFSKAWKKI